MIQPSKLASGSTIGILCPAGAIPMEKVTICAQVLESWGYQVRIGKTVGTQFGHFAASDLDRQNELQSMMDDPEIHAILCARGGYGLSRIVSQLDFTKIKAHPKWVIGFSDITILHAALQKHEIQSIHGPMSAAFGKGDAGLPYIMALKQMLEGAVQPVQANAHPAIIDKYHPIIEQNFKDLGIAFDIYHRTSDPLHHATASEFFKNLETKGDLEIKTSEQYFDEATNTFLADRYIKGTCPSCGHKEAYGDQCEKCGKTLSPEELINPVSTLSGQAPIKKRNITLVPTIK